MTHSTNNFAKPSGRKGCTVQPRRRASPVEGLGITDHTRQ